MADIKAKFGASNQSITVTLASLATAGVRSAAAIDNSTNVYLDALVQVKVKTGGSGTTSTGYVNVYAYGTADGGTSYPEGCGTDTTVTLTAPTNLRLIGVINAVSNATTYISEPMSVAGAFGGILPDHWGVAIENQTGGTFDATGGNFSVFYQGIYAQVN